jgi:hypothetical protein
MIDASSIQGRGCDTSVRGFESHRCLKVEFSLLYIPIMSEDVVGFSFIALIRIASTVA